ncbi:hypothetical protein RRG08_048400 [Elysia crispata]|uniref:Uncharacterized protein n=1 Tax=Elysia crispata TaxID=231223 RepID=A0AAE1B952_9GAST|nr:hypothetical protein RRG08_048400 [Elysia crispata]
MTQDSLLQYVPTQVRRGTAENCGYSHKFIILVSSSSFPVSFA